MEIIDSEFSRQYRNHKDMAKKEFLQVGGYGDIPRALTRTPESMEPLMWKKAVGFFQTPAHIHRSKSNSLCREKQVVQNRRGSQKYSSAAFKEVRLYKHSNKFI